LADRAQLKGTITAENESGIPSPSDQMETFLSHQSILWAPDMGDARQLNNHSRSSSTLNLAHTQLTDVQTSPSEPRLFTRAGSSSQDAPEFIGSFDIPFELLLPAITGRGTQDPERLPPSVEMSSQGKIEYSLAVVIHLSGILSKNERQDLENIFRSPSDESASEFRQS
jgi:hypothetical protein